MKHLIIIASFLFTTLFACAQERSSVTVTEKGKSFYVHTVAKGEGLYRISKIYDVTIDEIVNVNPHLANESLKAGEAIKIPYKVVVGDGQPAEQKVNSNGQIEHVIQPKETLYGISKKYDVSMEAIVALNPEVATSMPIGGTLIIPGKQQTPAAADNKPAETATEQRADDDFNDMALAADSTDVPIRIAYLLPFMTQSNRPDYKFTEFYQGALLAIKEASDAGIRLEVFTYDTDKTTLKAEQVAQENDLKTCDLIIGPAYPNQIQPVAELAFQNHIHTLIPFTNKVNDLSINPYLIQFNADNDSQQEALVAYLQKNEQRSNFVIIRTGQHLTDNTRNLAERLAELKITYSELPAAEFPSREALTEKLNANKKNIIIIDAARFSDTKDWLTALGMLGATYNICLIGDYGWLNYSSEIPVPMLFTSLFAPLGADNGIYESAYKKYFGELPPATYPQYDKLGYDMTRFFIRCLSSGNASDLKTSLPQARYGGLITAPEYSRQDDASGFMNRRIFILQARQGNVTIIE